MKLHSKLGLSLICLVATSTMMGKQGLASGQEIEKVLEEQATSKTMLFSNSFENNELEKFTPSMLDKGKGKENVDGMLKEATMKGDVTYLVDIDSIKGSKDHNEHEGKDKLFDKNDATKFLSSENNGKNIWVSFSLKEAKKITTYAIVSANDERGRDPKKWSFFGSSDGENWIALDHRIDESFEERYHEKQYTFHNENAYQYYKIEIQENNGANMTQMAEFNLGTGIAEDDQVLEQKTMKTVVVGGPSSAYVNKKNVGWSGENSLEVSGRQLSAGNAHAYNEIFEVDIPVTDKTQLSYVIFPSLINDDKYDYDYTSMHLAVDLKFNDGKYLSELFATDQNQNGLDPNSQGESRTLLFNQWNKLTSSIGEVAKGKTIKKILVGYENQDNEEGKPFRAFFDDIEIFDYSPKAVEHKSDYVNILRGSNDGHDFSRGLTIPAVAVPHGFNFWAPVTNANSEKLYEYQVNQKNKKFQHITISHQPSMWTRDRGTWQFMVNSNININQVSSGNDIDSNKVASRFSHEKEIAKGHYYGVSFDEKNSPARGTTLELTPSDHGAIARFTFDKNTEFHNVILDSVRANGSLRFLDDGKSFIAYTDHTSNGMKRMHIFGQFSEKIEKSNVQNNKQGIASFSTSISEVEMKVATSFISEKQAQANFELELEKENFDSLFKSSQKLWDEQLNKLDVTGATQDQLTTLYSNMYRLMLYPNNYSENTGTSEKPVWKYSSPYGGSNENPKVVDGKLFINNGFWDTYRTAWSAYSLLTPASYKEMLNGLVQHYTDNEWVPRWIAPGGTNSMVGTSSDIIFADAIMKNVDFETESAFWSSVKNASVVSKNLTGGGRNKLELSNFLGYVPYEPGVGLSWNGVGFSWSIEGYINDFGIAQMAEKLGYSDEAKYFKNRALNYSLLFDKGKTPEDSWLKGRYLDGKWSSTQEEFDPLLWDEDYTETDAYNMTVSVPQDGRGLANLYGGKQGLAQKLDQIINTPGEFHPGPRVRPEMYEAREIKLGQYGHNNQPAHHILYMYNFAGQPWKTQKYVRDILDRAYVGSDLGQGYIGDEDNGEMSAWYILSALGFYPLNLSSNEYVIGSPLFEKATVHLENGKDLIINAKNNSKENVYVQSVSYNGKNHEKTYFTHEQLAEGGTIDFVMGSEPNKKWGTSDEAISSSITQDDENPVPLKDMTIKNVTTEEGEGIQYQESILSTIENTGNLVDNTSETVAKIDNQKLIYNFNKPQKVEMMTLTSGTNKNRFEKIILKGSNDGEKWKVLREINNASIKWNQYTRPFAIKEELQESFIQYSIEFKGTGEIAEIELLGKKDNSITKNDLEQLLTYAKTIDLESLSKGLKDCLNNSMINAENILTKKNPVSDELREGYENLVAALQSLKMHFSAYSKIEAESYFENSGGVKNEGNNIGGLKVDSWTGYKDIDFGEWVPNYFEICYSGKPADVGNNPYVEVYANSLNTEPLFEIKVPKTKSWEDYKLASLDLTTEQSSQLSGLKNIYLKFKGENAAHVANVDWFRFARKVNLSMETSDFGAVTLVGDQVREVGETATFELNPDEGYEATQIIINGTVIPIKEEVVSYSLLVTEEDMTIKFIFTEKNIDDNPVVKIELEGSDFISLKKGDTKQIIATVKPENATNQFLTWIVEKDDILSVNDNGKITGLKRGLSRVTVSSANGVKKVLVVRVN